MSLVENEIAVGVPGPRVWRLLVDFPHYRDWHPFIRLAGEARLGAEIDYEFTAVLRTRRVRHSPARITRFEPNSAFEWQMGYRHVFQHIETYEVAPHPMGTRLHHRVEFRGMFSFLMRRAAMSAVHDRMCEADAALRAHLSGKTPANKARPTKRPSGHAGWKRRR